MNEHVSLTPDRGCRQTGDPGAGRDGAECRQITKKKVLREKGATRSSENLHDTSCTHIQYALFR